MKRRKSQKDKAESRDTVYRGGDARSSDEIPVMGMEQRGIIIQLIHMSTVNTGGTHGKQQAIRDFQTSSMDSI
ncbi:MAG: hypothetical protein GX102_16130 [Porphyromonadaceae bacterium]|nr:hypothetical protein [Porphyromonadaceae bacterium]